MKLYVMRHGETPWNALKKIQGIADIDLNENGRALAKITGEALKEVPFDLVISSPLSRAIETAKLVLGDRKVPVIIDERIQEINFGSLEGMELFGDVPPEAAEKMDAFFRHTEDYVAPENGEEIEEVCARTREFLEEVAAKEEYQDKTILVTSHGCAVRAMLQSVYEAPTDFWHGKVPPNCAVNILEINNGTITLVEEDKVYY